MDGYELSEEPGRIGKASMAMLRGTIRWLKARLCTGSLVLVLCVVAWFAISSSYHSLHRDPGGVDADGDDPLLPAGDRRLAEHDTGDYPGSRRVGAGSRGNGGFGDEDDGGFGDEEDTQFCRYPLSVNSPTSDVWEKTGESGSCDQPLEKRFHADERNAIRPYDEDATGKRFDRCEYRGIEWTTDSKFAYTEAQVRRSPAPFEVHIDRDFVHVQCYGTTPDRIRIQDDDGDKADGEGHRDGPAEEGKEEERPRSERDHGLRRKRRRRDLATESEGQSRRFPYRDVKDFHRSVVHRNAPSIYGSIGLPDLSDNVLSQKPSGSDTDSDALRGASRGSGRVGAGLSAANSDANSQRDSGRRGPDSYTSSDGLNAEHGVEAPRRSPGDVPGRLESSWSRSIGSPSYEQFLVQVAEKEEAKRMASQLAMESGSKGFRMNVLVLALDSISRASFEENFKESNDFLSSELHATVMNGYNSIGDAATAFVIPLLTGSKEKELADIRRSGDQGRYVDMLSFIWNIFEQRGYVTMYAEDQPDLGTFQTHFYGFEELPVNHYMRPFWLAVAESQLHARSHRNCLGSMPKHRYMFDYVADFFGKYDSLQKFAFGFLSEFNKTKSIDADLKGFLDRLRTGGHLDNTLLVIVGDHGTSHGERRGTVAGKFEESLPYLSLTFPAGFRKRYGQLMTNVLVNRDRLVTALDVHATLMSLLDVESTKAPVNVTSRAISLLQEIPHKRTCSIASIDVHWCSCVKYEQRVNGYEADDSRSRGLASTALDYINELISREDKEKRCSKLTLDVVEDVRVIFTNENVFELEGKLVAGETEAFNLTRRFPSAVRHRQVVFRAAPSDAVFEATVDSSSSPPSIAVSRINAYGRQSDCVLKSHPDLRKYCHCIQPDS